MRYQKIEDGLENKYRVNPVTGCWEWTGHRNWQSYGGFQFKGRRYLAHRVVASLKHGLKLEDRKALACHKCDVRYCINPDHLFVGSDADNMHDCLAKGRHFNQSPKHHKHKTHCKRGHPLSGSNLMIKDRSYRGFGLERVCISCQREHERKWWERKRNKHTIVVPDLYQVSLGAIQCPSAHSNPMT